MQLWLAAIVVFFGRNTFFDQLSLTTGHRPKKEKRRKRKKQLRQPAALYCLMPCLPWSLLYNFMPQLEAIKDFQVTAAHGYYLISDQFLEAFISRLKKNMY